MAKDLSRVVPKPASGKPQPKAPNAGTWRDPSQYDPAYLSQVGGQALVDVYEGLSQLPGTMYNVLRGFMERQRQKSPEELRGTADPYDTATYDAAMAAIEGAAREPVKTAKSAASALAEYGKKAVSGPAGMTQFLAENLTPLPRTTRGPGKMGVVKPKGGDFPKTLEAVKKLEIFEPDVRGRTNESTLNNWLNTKLDRYLRTEMATPEDPIRKLAEQGILHVAPEQINYNLRNYGLPQFAHPNETLLAKSETAKIWEGAADNQMGHIPVKSLVRHYDDFSEYRKLIDENPGLYDVAEKDPNRPLYFPSEEIGTNLGFEHLRDELYNSLRTDSNLPQQLRMTPEQLGRMSVPDAVRHVSKINRWREKQKAEANFALANNAATVPFKDYPDQKYGWYQLKADTPEGRQALDEALRYEGDMMGHCVDRYCDAVISGRAQIYSLRDKKTGAPHVTIEVVPTMTPSEFYHSKSVPQSLLNKLSQAEQSGMPFDWEALVRNSPEYKAIPKTIKQIKGKGNLKPKDEYIPFVQDFVKSGKWGRIKDYENAGLVAVEADDMMIKALERTGNPMPLYDPSIGVNGRYIMTPEALVRLTKWFDKGTKAGFSPPEFSDGGL